MPRGFDFDDFGMFFVLFAPSGLGPRGLEASRLEASSRMAAKWSNNEQNEAILEPYGSRPRTGWLHFAAIRVEASSLEASRLRF